MRSRNIEFGEIHRDLLYAKDLIQKRLGLSQHAWSNAIRGGLKVTRIGRQSFCLGEDVQDHFDKSAKQVQ